MWANNWLLGLPLLVATVVIHVTAFMTMTKALIPEIGPSARTMLSFNVSVGILALFAAVLHSFEAIAWALLYLHVGALPDFSEAILYSLEAITSYGHAPELLAPDWRLVGAIEAVNGSILFGLTTAFFFAAIQNAWPRKSKPQ
ncbi:hypothetical protein FQV39_20890 [Bosea sp. F3-2]|uniref:hypothetical protein n=1 Tax=Bosea sp. F3-2 TaxID=2599640 RepID=UPI0011EC6B14|nr:hypothetical protein [Bosea sp. F3-2]QEL24766.1 hypothetical protein FQV39_20890 [Bosea sp. F3-2]